jgi:hypothetical protein
MSRQTYYTAFVPSDGMHYPPDTAVYPLHHSPADDAISNYYFYQSDSRWVDGKLQLQRRYLAAREHRQFVTVRSTRSDAHLEVRGSGDALQVKNLLGADIELALLMDDDGRLHSVENLAANVQATAPLVDPVQTRQIWHARIDPKTPNATAPTDSDRYYSIFSRGRYRNYWGRNNSQWSPVQNASVLEQGILDIDRLLNDLKDGKASAAHGSERTFAAITTESIKGEDGEPLAPLGVRNSRITESLHVVRGGW